MKAVFYGLGSIGRRHMRLLQVYFPEVEIWHYNRFGIEGPFYEKLVDGKSWEPVVLQVFKDDFAVISNPTEAHIGCATACAGLGLNLFIEKPIDVRGTGLDTLIEIVKERELLAYVAYPLRFHPMTEYFLYHWHPGAGGYHFECRTDASRWPSARKLNHVILELSHELDLAQHLLGNIRGIRGDCTSDGFRASLTCDHGRGTVSTVDLDMSSPQESRFVRVNNHVYPLHVDNNLYLAQWIHFFHGLRGWEVTNTLEQAAGLFRRMEEFMSKEPIDK